MKVKIYPSQLKGSLQAPCSKSYAQRVIISALLCEKPCDVLINYISSDILTTIECVKRLGAIVKINGEKLTIIPLSKFNQNVTLDCGENASCLRFLLPIVSAKKLNVTFNASSGLQKRPIKQYINCLNCCESFENYPIKVTKQLQSGVFYLDGDVSSQYVSGLLMATPILNGDSKIVLTTCLQSKNYVDITIDVLQTFGIKIEKTDYGFYVKGNQKYVSCGTFNVEGDWSSASYYYLANYFNNDVCVENVNLNSKQGDRQIVEILNNLNGLNEIDGSDIIDLIPTIAVACALKNGKTKIYNVGRLRFKESDRIFSITSNLKKLNVDVCEGQDYIKINGNSSILGGVIDSFNDHRIIFAFAILGLNCLNGIEIQNAQAIQKSYPHFFDDLIRLGGKIDVI